jgi:hypothetical protein
MKFLSQTALVTGMIESSGFLFERSWSEESRKLGSIQNYLTVFCPRRFNFIPNPSTVIINKKCHFLEEFFF